MTRINANTDPKDLTRLHLIAELREITMVASSLKRSLRSKEPYEVLRSIPKKFTLNKGHVSFFYDKLGFLKERFCRLADEMEARGYNPNRDREQYFDGFPRAFYGTWEASEDDNEVVRERIRQRISEKPHLYEQKVI